MTKNSGVTGKTVPQAAEIRQRDRATRSTETQLAVLGARPGRSARERARLEAQR